MPAILAVTVPFFALVLIGFFAARRGFVPEAAIPGLNGFVLYFALPCMLVRFGAMTPIGELLNPVMLALWVAVALLVVFFTISLSLNERVGLKDASFGALVAAFPNSGFMGVPLLVALLGPAAAGPAIVTMLADMMVTSSLCLALAQAGGDGGAGARGSVLAAAGRALRGALSNPLPWSIAAGALLSVTGVQLPAPLWRVVELLAMAATPVALFTIGVVLSRAGRQVHTRTPMADVLPVALIKLFLHPLLVLALGALARQFGAPLSGFQLMVLVLVAALPSASNVSLLAERFGADDGRIARIIMASTAMAFVSFSALAWVFGVRPA